MAEDLTDDRPCAGKTNDDDVSSKRTLDLIVSPPLRQAEREVGLALAKLSDLRPGMISGWPGAKGETIKLWYN